MLQRVSFSFTVIFTVSILVLVACGGAAPTQAPVATEPPATEPPATEPPATEAQPIAWIDSITHNPAYPAIDGVVTFTIHYRNRSSQEVLTSAILEVTYDEQLIYCPDEDTSLSGETCQSEPEPVDNFPEDRYLKYELGDLDREATGVVTVSFIVEEISPQVSLNVIISGETETTREPSTDSARIVVYPNGGVEKTYSNGVLDIYPEGVTVWLPRQDSGKLIHSEETCVFDPEKVTSSKPLCDFDPFDPNAAPEGYELIRPLLYLDVFDESDEIVNEFSPAIEFTAEYSEADFVAANNTTDNLVILLYDRDLSGWIPCDAIAETDRTLCSATVIPTKDEPTGIGTISISKWTSGQGLGKRIAPQ